MLRLRISEILLLLLFWVNTAFASEVFTRQYIYQASEADSKLSCRAIALEQVKRLLLEELGTYLESVTEMKNLELTKDQITTLTAGVVRTEVVDEKWNGQTYIIKAKIVADPDEVVKSIDSLRQDKQKTKDLEDSRRAATEALKEIAGLRKEIEDLKEMNDTKQVGQYIENINKLSSTDWFQKSYALHDEKKYNEALDALSKTIELDPKNAVAYNNRAIVYDELGQHQQAITDYNKAIELNPKEFFYFYNNRGLVYDELGQHQQAIADYSKAIDLNPEYTDAYTNRGDAYRKLNQHQQAITDYNKAIKLNPKESLAYTKRGIAYISLNNRINACPDFIYACELGKCENYNLAKSRAICE